MPIRGENLPYFYIPPTIYKDILWAKVSEDKKHIVYLSFNGHLFTGKLFLCDEDTPGPAQSAQRRIS